MSEKKCPTVSTSLTIKGAAQALDFYQKAFGATVEMRMDGPDGTLMHANMIIGDTLTYLSDEFPEWQAFTPDPKGYSSTLFGIATEGDVDAEFQRAVDAGAEVVDAVADRMWGSRSGVLRDPYGYRWAISKMIEEVSPEEIQRRMQEMG